MIKYYFRTCCILAPNKAPGLDVGTRLNVTSPGMNRNSKLKTRLSDKLMSLCITCSVNHFRLSWKF